VPLTFASGANGAAPPSRPRLWSLRVHDDRGRRRRGIDHAGHRRPAIGTTASNLPPQTAAPADEPKPDRPNEEQPNRL